ncbi:MAG: hypothetical protein ACXVWU_05060 [Nocardioides sp.]
MSALNVVTAADAVPTGHYFQWGVLSISLANFLIIVVMVVVFVLAILIPFPGHRGDGSHDEDRS